MVNIDCYEGTFQFPLIIVIAVSITVSLLSMLMLHRLPQAIENLAFRVRKYSISVPVSNHIWISVYMINCDNVNNFLRLYIT